MRRIITIKDIARLAGVSITTVSKVINRKDHDISEATKKECWILFMNTIIGRTRSHPVSLRKKRERSACWFRILRMPFFPKSY
ncbi:LacI family DNA-binding transcriptional regulator [Paenibacillus cisolokensis]|uniref:LacI family DNA-binding transcriptional regulator n=1 Tax=Paenibacillus cisolokensis TaxID=1658519 RepID=UPI001FD10EA8|nr:LacI family DNA-binding transcriptional regulator [Paenibacillus cisolokensis]